MCVWLLFIVLMYKLFFGSLHLYNGNVICAVAVWFWIPIWISLKDSTVIWCMKMLLSLSLQLLSLYKSKVKIAWCYWVFELLFVCFQWKILVKLVNTEKRERTLNASELLIRVEHFTVTRVKIFGLFLTNSNSKVLPLLLLVGYWIFELLLVPLNGNIWLCRIIFTVTRENWTYSQLVIRVWVLYYYKSISWKQ